MSTWVYLVDESQREISSKLNKTLRKNDKLFLSPEHLLPIYIIRKNVSIVNHFMATWIISTKKIWIIQSYFTFLVVLTPSWLTFPTWLPPKNPAVKKKKTHFEIDFIFKWSKNHKVLQAANFSFVAFKISHVCNPVSELLGIFYFSCLKLWKRDHDLRILSFISFTAFFLTCFQKFSKL